MTHTSRGARSPRRGLDRRSLLLKAGASLLAARLAPASAERAVPIADMHSHLGLLSRAALGDEMRQSGIALVAWALPADLPWIHAVASGIAQESEPAPGAPAAFFAQRLEAEAAAIARMGLRPVRTGADVDACMGGGAPGVVLAAEGADFLEGRLDGLHSTHARGLRHLQLVHSMRSLVADRQTAEPTFDGLSAFGEQLVEACNELGLLVDLAHCSETAVDRALQVSGRPVVWSHGWVGDAPGRWQDAYGYQQRRLSLARAKAIAERGGVVGVWGFGLARPGAGRNAWPVGRDDPAGYARALAALVDRIGAEHVGIGSDLAGVGASASVRDDADVRTVVDHLRALGLPSSTVERVAGGNYARVLKAAMPV